MKRKLYHITRDKIGLEQTKKESFNMENMISGAVIGGIVGGIIGLVIAIPLIRKQLKINSGSEVAKSGKRFKKLVNFTGDSQEMSTKIDKFLTDRNYKPQKYGSAETVYRQGEGMMTAGKYFKFTPTNEGILIEAFVILFGVQESGLDGFTCIVSKQPLKKMTEEIIAMIEAGNKS